MSLKIVTIGGGSSYTPELCEGFIKRYQTLPITEWWLVDVKEGEEKLQIIGSLVKRMIAKHKLPIKVILSLDLKNALKDADFVTTQMRIGQLEARAKDEYIPLQYGMIGQETNGAGGLFKALRTIPVILEIVNLTEQLAKPNAFIINFTNPSGLVTEAVFRLTSFRRFIGLCNVPIHTKMDVAKLLNVAPDQIKYDVAGLNHLVYFLNFYFEDKNVTSKVIDYMSEPENSKNMTMRNISQVAWSPNFIRTLGAIPCPYHRYYYKSGVMLEEYLEQAKDKQVRASKVQALEQTLFAKYKDINLDQKPIELEARGGAYYSDAACGVINSIFNDDHTEHVVDTINDGKIANLPSDWVVEVTCKITKTGPMAVDRAISLPVATLGLVQTIKSFELLVVKAVAEKSLTHAYLALAIHPFSLDDLKSELAFKALVKAHEPYLSFYKNVRDYLK